MQLLLESGIIGYVDGLLPCPPQHCSISVEYGITSSSSQSDEYIVWKMHDRAIMQLITTTLSLIVMSCAIGSTLAGGARCCLDWFWGLFVL